MGISRKINKGMKNKVAMVDCKIGFNGCQLVLAHPNPAHVQAVAKEVEKMLPIAIVRSKCVTLGDMYGAIDGVHRSLWN